MSDISTERKGGVEDPNLAAFGIGGGDAPAKDQNDVPMATRPPAGDPPPLPTQAEIDAGLADLRGEGGEGGEAGSGGSGDATPPPSPGSPEALEAELNAWFDSSAKEGSVGGAGDGVPPSPEPAPPTVPVGGTDTGAGTGTQPDPNAPIPIPVLGPDGQPIPADQVQGQVQGQVPPSVTQPQTVSPVEQAFINQYGRLPQPHELQAMFQVQNDLQNMTPQQRAAVEQALYGQAQAGIAPTPPGTPPAATDPWDETIDPTIIDQRVQQYLAPVQQELQQTRAMLQQQAQESAAQAQARIVQEIEAGREAIQKQYNLTDEDTERFVGAVADTGIFNGFYSKHQNGTEAMKAAMEHALWADPGFRYVQQQRAQMSARVQEADDSQRRRKAGALAGGGGTVPRDEPVPTTPADRKAAMVTELQQAMNQG